VPQTNAQLLGFEVDFLWAAERVVVEVDGHQFHGQRRAFESDRRRDQILAARGYRVMRITWRQLQDEPLAVIDAWRWRCEPRPHEPAQRTAAA
jgi:very-short-patch-repair endonuclease